MRKIALASAFALAMAVPASASNIVETAQSAGTFNTLLAAAKAAGLADALATGDNLTVFAPTDEAFAKLPEGTVESLLKPENKDKLAAILKYHVVGSKIMSGDIADGTTEVATLKDSGDTTIEVTKGADGVMVDGAKVVAADVAADNGVIHVIDSVILPQD
ncbi:fasciclin [Zhengella mangrovi]|uniref:Fasciclin n=1 Tax=Zhengella mangrovi TaxID=1982044 RepID=A0A2G1QNR8_9HYPH|nr:fasciclin domain-containing protein [Zhengella mangrovi]PHP67100.1 fasciclin [Zhengella mangrovi]